MTPGELPDVPDEPEPPAGFEELGAEVVVVGVFDEHATRTTANTESSSTRVLRGPNGARRRPRRAPMPALSRFAFTRPPSVSQTSPMRPFPGSHTQLAMPPSRACRARFSP